MDAKLGLCFIFSHITWWENFVAVEINEADEKRNLKGLKDNE